MKIELDLSDVLERLCPEETQAKIASVKKTNLLVWNNSEIELNTL